MNFINLKPYTSIDRGRHKEAYDALLKYINFYYEHKEKNDQVDFKSAEVKQQLQLQLFADSLEYQQTIQAQQLENEKRHNRQRIIITIAVFGAGILAVFLVFIYRSLRVKKKNNQLLSQKNHQIEKQKEIVEEKNKEITDSINYAKRLQSAILPSMDTLKKEFSDSFVIYKPKDVVSGDFYWFEKRNDFFFVAAADCTGHGVPGAMVSVVCSNALNRCVNEFGILRPDEILNKTRELVIRTFAKSGADVKDGMDISLCAIDKANKKIIFAGANNPLWLLDKASGEMKDFKPSKQPIGLYNEMKDFHQTEIDLNEGDHIYLFTDGYADQFGGEKGKKLKYRPFRDELIRTSAFSASVQQKKLSEFFENWRQDYEQVDDVCVIGIHI